MKTNPKRSVLTAQLLTFIRKEFYHVFRDHRTLLILFGLPVVQILLFGFALSSEVKNIGIAVLDQAHDSSSQQLTERIRNSPYFIMREPASDLSDIKDRFKEGTIQCAVIFPSHFEKNLYQEGSTPLQLLTDGSDPNHANIAFGYLSAIIGTRQQSIHEDVQLLYQVQPVTRPLYNETQNGSLHFIPGVIALIFMIVSTALTSVAMVREKEMGTLEILLVSPFRPLLVLIAKAIPYLVLSFIDFLIILVLSVYVLDVTIQGSLSLLLAESFLFILTCLSLGLLISNLTSSQQTAMLVSMMGMMLPTLLLSGFLFPLENMPWIFRVISHVLPSRYYYSIVKAVMLKGLGLRYVWKETLILLSMTLFLLTMALKNFKIRLS